MQNLVRWKGNSYKTQNALEHGICKSPYRTEGVKKMLYWSLNLNLLFCKLHVTDKKQMSSKKNKIYHTQFFAL